MDTRLVKAAAVLIGCATAAFAEDHVRQIIISIPDRKLLLLEDGELKKIYPIAVGKPKTPSPVGSFQIANRVVNPTWYGPQGPVRPGKANPLGTRWMGIGYKGYGIHGTNAPSSIGKAASHGCIRMRTKDAEELFQQVAVGDEVQLLSERTELVARLLVETETAGVESTGGAQ